MERSKLNFNSNYGYCALKRVPMYKEIVTKSNK